MIKSLVVDLNGAFEKDEKVLSLRTVLDKSVLLEINGLKAVVDVEELKKALDAISNFQHKSIIENVMETTQDEELPF